MSAPGPSQPPRRVSPGEHLVCGAQFSGASAVAVSLTVSPPSLMLTTE
jgi:hypothetical protein